ncbi:HNH endonuclease [Microbacterium sp. NPDC090007]|uniref:HNH endonuclease n=1 Tax=Microbacterium sp. NPDC090007 TaxID=3364204 RepID=UPI00380C7366
MDDVEPLPRLCAAVARLDGLVAGRAVEALHDDEILRVMSELAATRNALDVLVARAARAIDARSARELGVAGLAQRRGHRTATELLQTLTGQTRVEVTRAVRTGGELVGDSTEPRERASVGGPAPAEPWRDALRHALRAGAIGQAQFQAVLVGLGAPPVERYPEMDADFLPRAWAVAVEKLIAEAPHVVVEELRASARVARDRLDPVGVTLRFEERFAARSYRSWIDEHGQRHGRFVFDDDAAAWVDAILQAALRPRRGPRFVDTDARVADAGDDRSGEQIAYDTLIAVLRTGAAADPAQAFGDRQPGVRIVVEAAAGTVPRADGGAWTGGAARAGTGATAGAVPVAGSGARTGAGSVVHGGGHLEDGGEALPRGVVESYVCDAGTVAVSLDDAGRPLDVGRHQRLFTRAQRIAIAVRDGGCIGVGCRAPVSQCEMHHIDHWAADRGRTDVDDGVALCRNHHLGLHNRGERIVRQRDPATGRDSYWLHAPPNQRTGEVRAPMLLRSRSPRRFQAA